MARARGTLEFDARQRAYGGHIRAGKQNEISMVPLRHGTKAVGLLAAVAPVVDIGALDAVAGVVAIAVERAQFLAEREAADLVQQKADLAATLLASLSHDLRTPLTAIRVAVENLRDDLPADDRRAQAAAAIAELQRLTRLFADILDMARIDAAAVRVDRQWVAAVDVVDAAAAHVRHALEGRALRIDADAEREVEAPASSARKSSSPIEPRCSVRSGVCGTVGVTMQAVAQSAAARANSGRLIRCPPG
jgi:two-component system sensor histidine kinase KdpD